MARGDGMAQRSSRKFKLTHYRRGERLIDALKLARASSGIPIEWLPGDQEIAPPFKFIYSTDNPT
jgi:hypothetical protein